MSVMSLLITCTCLVSLAAAHLSNFYVNAGENQPTDDKSNLAAAEQRLLNQRLFQAFVPILQAETAAKSMTHGGGGNSPKTKKSWQKLQGSWGKRSDLTIMDDGDDVDPGDGEDGGGGDGRSFDFNNDISTAYEPARLYFDDADLELQQQQRLEPTKRAWNSMSAGWGKRIGTLFPLQYERNIH